MQTSLKNINSNDVPAYFIWLPCIRGDSKEQAIQRVSEFQDSRVHNYWDENRISGIAWQQQFGLPSFAWDVYFLFDRAVKWEKDVPQPTFWMHQLWTAEGKAPFLNQPEFELRLKGMLSNHK